MKIYLRSVNVKIIGTILIVSAFILFLLLNKNVIDFPVNEKISQYVLKGIALFGFLLIILSKEKIEDEFIKRCRLLGFSISLILGIIIYLSNLLTGVELTGFSVLIIQVVSYIILFRMFKWGWIK